MTILYDEIKDEWEVENLSDFLITFKEHFGKKFEKLIRKHFPKLININDVYQHKDFRTDQEHIEEILKEMIQTFRIEYIKEKNVDYWKIKLIN